MANDSLVTLYSWSLGLNNLINISLMRDLNQKYNKFFVFFNVVPSSKNDDGSRSYNFRESINFKLAPIKLFEIYQVINAYIKGQSKMIGTYGIMTDTSKSNYGDGSGGVKSLYFNYTPADSEKNHNIPGITVVGKSSGKSIIVGIPAPSALAFAEVCNEIFKYYIQTDIENYTSPEKNSNDTRGKSFNNNHDSPPSEESTSPSEEFTNFNDAPF